jgi:glycosyltransferase involved in cell wall biosynthesis
MKPLDPGSRAYYTVAVPPHSGLGRVGAALRRGLNGFPNLQDYVFDYKAGGLLLKDEQGVRKVANGLTTLPKNAFNLSLTGRVPKAARGFIDNQNLAFLKFQNCGICLYDLFYLTHPDRLQDRLLGKLLYRGMGDYPFYLAISQYTKDVFCDMFRVPAGRVHTVPLDCDREIFRPLPVDRGAFLRQWGLPEDRRYLLHVSSGDKRKNFGRILEAFSLIRSQFPDTDLVRVGSTLHADNLRRERESLIRLGLNGRVHHRQGLSDTDLATFYNVAEAFVFPSVAEGFGLPVLEAQASGCPCVTSNNTALGEIAGPLCDTVDPLDTSAIAAGLQSVLDDAGRRAREATANQKFLERFEWGTAQRLLREWMA